MNAKLLLKMVFLMIMLLLLVLMGLNNRGTVSFSLPPLLPKAVNQPAAIMYFAFFAAGVLTGTILNAGGGRKSGGGSGAGKPAKSDK